jgi:hypothetical protein
VFALSAFRSIMEEATIVAELTVAITFVMVGAR